MHRAEIEVSDSCTIGEEVEGENPWEEAKTEIAKSYLWDSWSMVLSMSENR